MPAFPASGSGSGGGPASSSSELKQYSESSEDDLLGRLKFLASSCSASIADMLSLGGGLPGRASLRATV